MKVGWSSVAKALIRRTCLRGVRGTGGAGSGDALPHLGICRDVLELVVIHDFHLAVFQGVGDCKRNARFGGDVGGSTLFDLGEHFLFDRDGLGPSAFGASTGDARVGLGPVGL